MFVCVSSQFKHRADREQASQNMKKDIRQRRRTAAGILLSSKKDHLSQKIVWLKLFLVHMMVKASQKGFDEVTTAAEMLPAEWKICKISYDQQVSTVVLSVFLFPPSTIVTVVKITYGN